jgi:hypothetical protein
MDVAGVLVDASLCGLIGNEVVNLFADRHFFFSLCG